MKTRVGITDDDFQFIIHTIVHYVEEHDLPMREVLKALSVIKKIGQITNDEPDIIEELREWW